MVETEHYLREPVSVRMLSVTNQLAVSTVTSQQVLYRLQPAQPVTSQVTDQHAFQPDLYPRPADR